MGQNSPMETGKQQPLLSGDTRRNNFKNINHFPPPEPATGSLPFVGDVQINGVKDFCREFYVESKRLWYLAGPAISTTLCQYTIGAATQLFAGQLGTIHLAAVSVENSVIAGFSFSALYGMGSALETLCGQAYGAGKIEMLGIYLQRSWIVLNATAMALMLTYIFGVSVLRLLGQTTAIATAAGRFSVWMIPQLFAYATVIPTARFLQAQSNIMPTSVIAFLAVVSHVFLSWVVVMKLGWGLVGAAMVLDGSWWFMTVALVTYVLWGSCGEAWSGFSWKAFRNLKGFVHVSFTTSLMFCLETLYTMSLILITGYLNDPEVSVDALSVCLNILGWVCTFSTGFSISASVRVSNELGYGRPKTARFAVIVEALTSLSIGLLFSMVLIVYRKQYPMFFTNNWQVMRLVEELTFLLGFTCIVTSSNYALTGVAIGAGWQTVVAYMNIGSYFFLGIPLGVLLGFKFNMGVKGIWYGMASGTSLRCFMLLIMISRTNWNKEAKIARDRVERWGDGIQTKLDDEE